MIALVGLVALSAPGLMAGRIGQLVDSWLPARSLGPRLYLATDRDPSGNLASPQINILDPASLAPLFSTSAGDDAILTADQRRMYVASTNQITAIEVPGGRQLWQLPLKDRVVYIGGAGPSSLSLAPDGSELYVLSYDSRDSSAPVWFQVVDTATGVLRPALVRPVNCTGFPERLLSPSSGHSVYIVCPWIVLTVDTRLQIVEKSTELLSLPSVMSDALLSRDNRYIYLLMPTTELIAIDTTTGSYQTLTSLPRPADRNGDSSGGALALSANGNTLLALVPSQSQPGNSVGDELFFYDTRSWELLRRVRVDRPLQGLALAISPDGRTIYGATGPVADMPFGADTLVAIDALTGKIVAEHPRPGEHILRMWLMPGTH